ncbi:hypothetical protein [Streptomyces noursei]
MSASEPSTTTEEEATPEVGDLVRDVDKDLKAVVTDKNNGKPLLRYVIGGGRPWHPTGDIEILARRGEWTSTSAFASTRNP